MTENTNDTLVELDGLRKEYGEVVAVDDVNFDIRRGEFFSLVGPSGCGKTTTLRMISGFEQPTSGTIRLDGKDSRSIQPNERDTNLVFQHLSLFPHMTVGENVEYGPKKAGVDAESRRSKAEEYLSLVDLDGYYDRKPNELSGGQQQRVALARALVNEPSILLFDEPLSSLDRKLRKQMQVELRKIHQKVDGAFFYVTHDQEVAMTLSDRMAVLNDGHVEQVGTPEEIYRNPASPFVADFIGDTNLVEGHAADGTVTLGSSVSFPATDVAGDVTVSVRPEDIDIVDASMDASFTGLVTERYFQGDQTQYVVAPDDDELPDITIVVQGDGTRLDQGESGTFVIPDDAPTVFEK